MGSVQAIGLAEITHLATSHSRLFATKVETKVFYLCSDEKLGLGFYLS